MSVTLSKRQGASCLIAALMLVTMGIHAEIRMDPPRPVFDVGPSKAWDSRFVEPGPIVFHDDRFHMFYTGLPQWPGNIAVGYATSEDGLNWQRAGKAPILTIDETPYTDESITSDSIVVTDDGQWLLYFGIGKRRQHFVGSVGLAVALSPAGPWHVHPEPVLLPGPEGSWDGNKVGHADVFKTDDGYVMYYTGYGDEKVGGFDEEHGHIGRAVSKDGIHWTKHDDPNTTGPVLAQSDPVLSRDPDSNWDSWHVKDSNVRRVDGRWKMLYHGTTAAKKGNFGFAWSDDGIHWQRSLNNPVIEAANLGKVLYFATYIRHRDEDHFYIEAGSPSGTKVIRLIED